MRCIKVIFYSIICVFIIAITGCIKESETRIKEKLNIILKDDLTAIISDISKENLSDSIYFDIVSYTEFKEGKYSIMAVVDFYFFSKVEVKIVRKYRFETHAGKWERYFNEYRYYDNDSNDN